LKGQAPKKLMREIKIEEAEQEEKAAYKEYMAFKKSNSVVA
jgi:hypothetical protein